jgi:hypothetical protein
MRLIAALISVMVLGGQTYPPPYPRSGTKSLIDNERAQVWDVSWPKGQPSGLHRHLYDMTGLYYWPGDRIITAVDRSTRNISTKAGAIQWQLKGITHIEEGTSEDPLRAVMIELKGDGPSGKVVKASEAPAFSGPAMPLLDNERVIVWDYPGTASPVRHVHTMDTFVVWTEGRSGHAIFLPAGTIHTTEPISAGAKATIFELK